MNRDHFDLDRLAVLDPSRERVLTDAEKRRADAALDRIVAEDPVMAPSGRASNRAKLIGGVGGATIALVASTLLFGTAANASWKPVPDVATPEQAAEQATDCTASWQDDRPSGQVLASDIILAERRGDGRLTLLRKGDTVVSCFDIGLSEAGWGVIYDPLVSVEADPAVDSVRVYAVETTGDGAFGYNDIVGRLGEDVTGVDIVAKDGTVITASISDGWFAAWWPGVDSPYAMLESQVIVHTGDTEHTSVVTELE